MATNTYVALAEYTLASNGGTVTFSNISQQYRDLRLVVKGGFVDSGFLLGARVGNSSVSTTGYAYTAMRGNGSSATSAHKTDMVFGAICQQGGNNLDNIITVDFMNYSNTTTQKTWLSRYGNGGEGTDSVVSTWRSTSAIDTIAIAECGDGGSGAFNYGNMLAGTTFTLYGIGGVGGESAPKALGGEVFSDADYYYHLYRGAGTFQPLQSLTADILVVAGGGGAIGAGGGGGGGGLLGFASQSLTAQAYPVFVGAGGVKGSPGSGAPTNGNNSKFGDLTTAVGGAGGGGYNAPSGVYQAALSGGGSGGGGAYYSGVNYSTGISGQGNSGSNGRQGTGGGEPRSGGGGGGAGGAAASGSDNVGGNGGIGATYNSTVGGTAGPYAFINAMGAATGTGQLSSGNYYYAGGGGGEGKNTRGAAGLGGGGRGGTSEPAQYPDAGTANTGGGAGAGPNASSSYGGANGGSGVVIVRYAK